jgi:hypothetical protein
MAQSKLKAVPNRCDEAAIDAIETVDLRIAKAKAIIRVLECAYYSPTAQPRNEDTAFALSMAAELLDEAERLTEAVISGRPSAGPGPQADSG